jgi:hypothetical protein
MMAYKLGKDDNYAREGGGDPEMHQEREVASEVIVRHRRSYI